MILRRDQDRLDVIFTRDTLAVEHPQRQIEQGGPVTITHPEMTRFFISIAEAVSLVIEAATMTRGGDIFMLDMGQPIRIEDLAHKMIRLRGLRPGADIAIAYTGVRPGEKLHEELYTAAEARSRTGHPKIFRIASAASLARSGRNCQLTAPRYVVFEKRLGQLGTFRHASRNDCGARSTCVEGISCSVCACRPDASETDMNAQTDKTTEPKRPWGIRHYSDGQETGRRREPITTK